MLALKKSMNLHIFFKAENVNIEYLSSEAYKAKSSKIRGSITR